MEQPIPTIEEILKNSINNFPIPIQHILVKDLDETKHETPHVKLVPVNDLQTLCFPVYTFYKPISKII
jgi:hypothetical protein